MRHDRWIEGFWGWVNFDPLTALSMSATAASGVIGASNTLAAGDDAAAAGRYKAEELRQNASQALASSQRKMFDTQRRTRLAISTSTARAAASGVAPDVGSPVENAANLDARGSYQALLDLWNGQSNYTGLRNEADLAEWEGEEKKRASRLAAAGTLAGSFGTMFKRYGDFEYGRWAGAKA